ncbi:MAG: hypothetical protein WAT39_18525, partial [Planctomycetota bacterium]
MLVGAAFIGNGATPAAGDILVLTFSEAVTLVANALLDDTDLSLSDGATLGAVTAVPTQVATNSASLVLGPGVTFAPDSTTITFRTGTGGNTAGGGTDAVRDTSGVFGASDTPVAIRSTKAGDTTAPTLQRVTLAMVDDLLNGRGPAAGSLQVPSNGFTIDIEHSDNGAIANDKAFVSASVAVSTPGGVVTIGGNLTPSLTLVTGTAGVTSFRVPGTVTFPDGPVTITAVVVDTSGLGSVPKTFAGTVRAFNAQRQPFETNVNASQVWFLDFSRDIESFTGTTTGVTVNNGANGRSDFEDILRIVGLNGTDNAVNAAVNARFKQALLAELAGLYTGANVTFTLTQPAGTFTNPFVPYASLGFSRISIAGASDLQGVLGVAIFDPNNEEQNDNTVTNFGGSTRLGVFLHTIVDSQFGSDPTSLFHQTFDQFVPIDFPGPPVGAGIPIGTADAARVNGTQTDARSAAIDTAIADFARFTAIVTGHECGHSVGLVVNGAMPLGLYGNNP